MEMFCWVKKFWRGLTEEDKHSLERDSKLVVQYLGNSNVQKVALRTISKLMGSYEWIKTDCYLSYANILKYEGTDVVCYSDIQVLTGYFSQFISKKESKKPVEVPVESVPIKPVVEETYVGVNIGTKLKVKNDFYGVVIVKVFNITGSSYMCCYEKDGETIIKSWRIPKNSPRILQVIG